MLFKIFTVTISFFVIMFVNNSYKPAYSADCEAHLSRPGASKAKEMAKRRKALKELEKIEEPNSN